MTGGTAPRVAVVILNWNGADHTEHSLASLFANSQLPTCVVVVDNASRASDVARVRGWMHAAAERHDWRWLELRGDADPPQGATEGSRPLLVLQSLANQRGFSGGNNAGVRTALAIADPTHVLLLNNDTELSPDYFETLGVALHAAPGAALLSGTIREFHARERVWYAGGRLVPLRALAVHDTAEPAGATLRPTGFITGCAMVISREGLGALGPLPECYFPAYMEDAEYSWRAAARGLDLVFAPAPTVYHHGGATTGRAIRDPWPAYLNVRHRVFFIRRNLRGAARWLALGYMLLTKPGRATIDLLRGRPAMASAVMRGLVRGMMDPVDSVAPGRR